LPPASTIHAIPAVAGSRVATGIVRSFVISASDSAPMSGTSSLCPLPIG
jgi:hypothetical protein